MSQFLPFHQIYKNVWSPSASFPVSLPPKEYWASLNTSHLFYKSVGYSAIEELKEKKLYLFKKTDLMQYDYN